MIPIDEGFDLYHLMVWMAIGVASLSFVFSRVNTMKSLYTLEDKTAIRAINDNTPVPYTWDTRDVLLMLMVADEYSPMESRRIKLSTSPSVITMDSDWLTRKEANIQKVYIENFHSIIDRNVSTMDTNRTEYWNMEVN